MLRRFAKKRVIAARSVGGAAVAIGEVEHVVARVAAARTANPTTRTNLTSLTLNVSVATTATVAATSPVVIKVIGANCVNPASPVVASHEGFAVSGESATSTTSSNTATANLPSTPSTANADIVFWPTDPTPVSQRPPASPQSPASKRTTTAVQWTPLAGAPPLSSLSLSLGSNFHRGTIALELSHS